MEGYPELGAGVVEEEKMAAGVVEADFLVGVVGELVEEGVERVLAVAVEREAQADVEYALEAEENLWVIAQPPNELMSSACTQTRSRAVV